MTMCWYRFSVQLWVQLRREVVIHAVHAFKTGIGVKRVCQYTIEKDWTVAGFLPVQYNEQ